MGNFITNPPNISYRCCTSFLKPSRWQETGSVTVWTPDHTSFPTPVASQKLRGNVFAFSNTLSSWQGLQPPNGINQHTVSHYCSLCTYICLCLPVCTTWHVHEKIWIQIGTCRNKQRMGWRFQYILPGSKRLHKFNPGKIYLSYLQRTLYFRTNMSCNYNLQEPPARIYSTDRNNPMTTKLVFFMIP